MSNTVGFKEDWYRDWFGEDYLAVYTHRDEQDAEALITLLQNEIPLASNSRILDVGCGNGRHAIQLANAGYTVFGVDLSIVLLRQAKQNITHSAYPLICRADMRFLPFQPGFDLLLSLFTSFGYFRTDQENELVIKEYAHLLNNKAYLVIDYFNPEYLKHNLVPLNCREVSGIKIDEKRFIMHGRVYKEIILQKDNTRRVYQESVRIYSLDQIEKMLTQNEMQIVNVFGEYSGEKYTDQSGRMIIIAKKK